MNHSKDELRHVPKLKRSKAYRIAYHDHDFMDMDYNRPVRLQLELLKPEMIFRDHDIISTIVVFGGTRLIEEAEARDRLNRIEKKLARDPENAQLSHERKIAGEVLKKAWYYEEARKFGRLVSAECQTDHHHEYVIVTGGGPGIMEAANRGAYDVNGVSIGLNITLPLEQEPNPFITPELCMQFHYFAIRKMHFLLRAKALVAFPGGYGTLDELFEALTLVQTKKVKPLPIVLFGEQYWKRLIDFDYLVEQGTIDPADLKLFVYSDSAEDTWNYIKYFYRSEFADPE